jgi:nucleotide-binding universal stress UspA family protein
MPASSLRTKTPVMHITATFDALEVKRSSVMMSEQRRRMKMKVLLATDGSKFSQAATDAVISQCQPRGTEVKVLNVVDLPLMIPTLYAAEFREEGLRQGEEVVRGAEQQLTKAGYRVEAEVDEGDPKSKIVEDAARWNADLIVLGSHGRKGVDRFLMGSVSDAVSRHAPCSVQIVRVSTNGKVKETGRLVRPNESGEAEGGPGAGSSRRQFVNPISVFPVLA